MTRRNRLAALALAAGLLIAATGCDSVNTGPGQVALHYSGGSYSSQKFQECIDTSTRKNNQGTGEKFYYYPAGRRTFKFSKDPGSDFPPLTVSTSNNQELTVSGTIQFTLNTDCAEHKDGSKTWKGGKRQKFHETIGTKTWAGEHAYTEDGEDPGKGWNAMIGVYIKDPVDRALDNEALKYPWSELYSDTTKKAQWERDVIAAIPALIKAQAGDDLFKVDSIVLQKPDIPEALKAGLTEKEAAILRAAAAGTDKNAAAGWPGGIQAYLAYQRQLSINKAMEKGLIKVVPVPDGATLNLPAS